MLVVVENRCELHFGSVVAFLRELETARIKYYADRRFTEPVSSVTLKFGDIEPGWFEHETTYFVSQVYVPSILVSMGFHPPMFKFELQAAIKGTHSETATW